VATGESGGGEDAGDRKAAREMTVRTLLSKDLSADLSHIDVVCIEGFCQDAIVHVTVGVDKKEDIFTSSFPLLDL
jgi:molybdopterin-guanine dinucleotide biosynthesis protein